MLAEPQTIEVEPTPSRKLGHSSLPSRLGAGSSNTTGPEVSKNPTRVGGDSSVGFRGCSAIWGECGDAATTIDMPPLQQRIGSLSLANGKRNSLLALPLIPDSGLLPFVRLPRGSGMCVGYVRKVHVAG